MGARQVQASTGHGGRQFQLTRPAWGRGEIPGAYSPRQQISTHTPRMGARLLSATKGRHRLPPFQLTRPAWGRGVVAIPRGQRFDISTHTPRMGARLDRACKKKGVVLISTHTPRMGARPSGRRWRKPTSKFQLTRPAWGRGTGCGNNPSDRGHFNSHAPHGGAAMVGRGTLAAMGISTHTPRMGARRMMNKFNRLYNDFNSHAPHGGAAHIVTKEELETLFQLTRPAWGRGRHPL